MDNWPPQDGDYGFENDTNYNNNFQSQHTDDIEDIIRNINQKASNKRFELNIADEEFYQIPDVEYKSHRYKEMEDNIQRENSDEDVKTQTSELPNIKDTSIRVNKKPINRKPIKRTGVFGGALYSLLVVGVSVVLAIMLLQSAQDFLGLFKEESDVQVTIKEGDTLKDVAKKLESIGVISQPFTFEFYTKHKEKVETINPGKFDLNTNMSYGEIVSRLQKQQEKGVVEITLVEGRTIFDLAELLEEKGVCTADAFLEALKEREKNPVYEWESEIPDLPERYSKYEGYFFPNTHQMYIGEEPSSVIKKFLKNFDYMINQEIRDRAEYLGMSLDELITLASLLEKEAAGSEENLDKVSAVFHNRLNNPGTYPKLQSDVTINYVNDFIEGKVTEEQRVMYASAYNTYKTDGLPVGPVCNPGTDAIRSALYPAENFGGIYFFVTDIKNQFYYSTTNAEHNRKVAIAESVTNDDGESVAGGLSIDNGTDHGE